MRVIFGSIWRSSTLLYVRLQLVTQ